MAKAALKQDILPVIRLLMVEDDASDAFLVGRMLGDVEKVDYHALYAHTQSEAVLALSGQAFDVCILDLTLPDADGFSALIHIQEKAPDMPVLILTGVNDTAIAKQAVSRGAQDYLLKNELEASSLVRSIDYAIARKCMEKSLFTRANFDPLTGLANRSMFESRLGMALARMERTDNGVAVLFIDLDGFKPINDGYGHDAGDALLKTIAGRLVASLRAYDTAARFGGDEFVILLEDVVSFRNAAFIAQKVLSAINAPVVYERESLYVSASIGIAFSDVRVAPDMFLQRADIAMYQAKKEGGNRYRFYESQ